MAANTDATIHKLIKIWMPAALNLVIFDTANQWFKSANYNINASRRNVANDSIYMNLPKLEASMVRQAHQPCN